MKFSVSKPVKAVPNCDLLLFPLFKTSTGTKKPTYDFDQTDISFLGRDLSELFSKCAKKEGFSGKESQLFWASTLGQSKAESVAFYGLGEAINQNLEQLRKFGGDAFKLAHKKRAAKVVVVVSKACTLPMFDVVQALTEGFLLSSYNFDKYQTKDTPETFVEKIEFIVPAESSELSLAIARAEQLSESVMLARDLINEGPWVVNPQSLAEEAKKVAEISGLKVDILDEKALKKERMNLMLAVGNGAMASAPPRLIRLQYHPKTKSKDKRVIALVGKGVTFDSGGLDIKTAEGMLEMKIDMSGAAAVLGTMMAIGKLKPQVSVVGYLGCVENAVGPHSYHPGDIITSRQGLTIEINNTDAEGRLVLADVMSYAQDHDSPDILIDIATLTGACVIALGPKTAGIFSNNDNLCASIIDAGKSTGESFWRLPLLPELKDMLKSNVADMKNTGERWGGAITAALFLEEFISPELKWAHLDIAGPASSAKNSSYIPAGGVGFAVRTLVDFIMSQK